MARAANASRGSRCPAWIHQHVQSRRAFPLGSLTESRLTVSDEGGVAVAQVRATNSGTSRSHLSSAGVSADRARHIAPHTYNLSVSICDVINVSCRPDFGLSALG